MVTPDEPDEAPAVDVDVDVVVILVWVCAGAVVVVGFESVVVCADAG